MPSLFLFCRTRRTDNQKENKMAENVGVMLCGNCSNRVYLDNNFCGICGEKVNIQEFAIRFYFAEGFQYKAILELLRKYHGIEISMRTLKKRLKALGLKRKSLEFDEGEVRRRIEEDLDGPASLDGYRNTWHTLRREGFNVPRRAVERFKKEIDPEGCEARRRHRLKRRLYVNPGPNHCWHMDGYDKLKPYGFPIHGCIDGFSRKMLWLKVSRTNNNPFVVGQWYLETVESLGGCPMKIRTDCGTENGFIAAVHCYFLNDEKAHVYGTSPHNQRI